MPYRVYAMDTYFYNSLGSYDFNVRCEMLKELGYDATYLTAWNDAAWADVAKIATVKQKHGLDVAAVYVTLDLGTGEEHPINQKILNLVETLEGCPNIEIAMRWSGNANRSDAGGDEIAQRWLLNLLERSEKTGVNLLLYPHFSFWLERIDDATRICRKINHPRIGAVFCGFHWYAVDRQNLAQRLGDAAPYLRQVNLCGSRPTGQKEGMVATIEPLDEGELDNFAVVGLLREIGYRGLVGFQGYSTGGDVYPKLKRSLTTFRDIEHRLDRHPNWAKLRP